MRIAIDIKALKNGRTGISRYLRSLMDWLQKIDNKNQYFLFECKKSDYEITNNRWQKVLIPSRFPGTLWQQFVLPSYLKKYAIDTLWAPEQICPVYAWKKIRVVTSIHDCAPFRYPQTCEKSVVYICRLFFSASLKRSSVILPVSDFTKRELLNLFPQYLKNKRMQLVANGRPDWVLPDDYDSRNRGNFLFFAGNMEPRKNLLRLLNALEIVKEKIPEIRLVIAGPEGWKNGELLKFLNKDKLKKNIEITGYISEQRLQWYYLNCKAFVYPSLYEGFGLPVLESFLMDAPVLTSSGTVMQEIAKGAGIYFDPLSVENIAERILDLYANEFDRNKYLNNSKSVLDEYQWHKSAELLHSVLTE